MKLLNEEASSRPFEWNTYGCRGPAHEVGMPPALHNRSDVCQQSNRGDGAAHMKRLTFIAAVVVLACSMPDLTFTGRVTAHARGAATEATPANPLQAPTAAQLDQLLAPIALYPDQLLAQVLLCAADPAGVTALNQFIKSHPTLKGSDLQDAVLKDSFEASFVALALFPQTVAMMAGQLDKTAELGRAFAADKTAVFASIQRLRAQARNVGNLKSTPQQEVETKTTSSGEQVIVIEPA